MTNIHRGLLTFVFVLAVALAGSCLATAQEAYRKTPTEAWEYIVATPDVYILDVRSAEEFSKGYINGAVNIPVGELEERIVELPEGRPVLVHCMVGKRSERAYQIIRAKRPELQPVFAVTGNVVETSAPAGAPAIITAP